MEDTFYPGGLPTGSLRGYSTPMRPRVPMEQRFWNRVEKTDGCWNIPTGGWRPRICLPGRNGVPITASRYAYELLVGPVPSGMWVLHTCDNGNCVRPEHLYLGTQTENEKDKADRGRVKGTRNPSAKLNEADVRAIRKMLLSGSKHADKKRIAQLYGVSWQSVDHIHRGLKWGWLND